jgi:membrane protease YdiL (CAAX protease family)
MTSPIEPRTASLYHASRAPAVKPAIAAVIVLETLAAYLVIPWLVTTELVLLVGQAVLAIVPIAAVLVLHRARPFAALGLRGARPRFLVAAVLIGATAWYVNIRLVSLFPLPEHHARVLAELVDRPSLLHALTLFALVPALCEEILFRGVLARSLGRALPIAFAAVASAAVFAAYHLSVVQALPTLTLGTVLAVLAIRADSVLPTIVAHALNNVLAIAMSRGELPAVAAWFEQHPTLALAGCAAATAGGLAIALRGAGPGDRASLR